MICRVSLFLLSCVCLAGQNLTVQQRIDVEQKLMNDLRGEAANYTARHPELFRWNGLMAVLENEVALLRAPESEWSSAAVARQVTDLGSELETLKAERVKYQAKYQDRHPDMVQLRAIIGVLENELQALQRH